MAELHVRIPDELRCIGEETEWRGGFASKFQHIFLEGPVADTEGNLYVVDIPYGRILKIDSKKNVTVAVRWDGEPNGLVGSPDGTLVIADYKQVSYYMCRMPHLIMPELSRPCKMLTSGLHLVQSYRASSNSTL